MKRIIIVLLLVVGLATSVVAEGTVVDSKGTMALQFTVSGLIGDTTVAGAPIEMPAAATTVYGIGGKYFLMDKLGLGLDLLLAGASDSGASTSSFYLGLKPSASYTLVKKGPLELYGGGFLSLGIYNNETAALSNKRSTWGFGGTIGAEYFVLNGISLGAAYDLGIYFDNTSSTNKTTSVTTSSSDNFWGMNANAVNIFLTFYI